MLDHVAGEYESQIVSERRRLRDTFYPPRTVVRVMLPKPHVPVVIKAPVELAAKKPKRDWLSVSSLDFPPDRRMTIRKIGDAVAHYYGVTWGDICAHRRAKKTILPRQITMYLARHLTRVSLPAIGRLIGGRDHSTVHHSVVKIEKMLVDDADLKSVIFVLRHSLSGEAA